MTEKSLPHHNFSGLNRGEIKDFKDYLTLLKEGFLFNLNFEKIKIEGFTKNSLIAYLYAKLEEKKETKDNHTKLKEKIYYILKKIITYDYSGNNKSLEDAIKESLEITFKELNINQNIDDKLIKVFFTIYKKSSFLTRLDLMAVKGVNKNELITIIYKELQLNPEEKGVKKKAIKKINKSFRDTINLMSTDFKLKIPQYYENKEWKSLDEFLNFILSTSEESRKGYLRVIDCAILKTMSAYSNILDNPLLHDLDLKLQQIIKKIKKIPGFKIIKESDGEIEFSYNNPTGQEPSYTSGKISFRTKDDLKILLKLLYNRKYSKLDFFKDLLGFRIEVDNEKNGENAVLLFRNLFDNNIILKNKGFLNQDFIQKCSEQYNIITEKEKEKNEGTNEGFINASLSGNFKIDNDEPNKIIPPAEIQIVYTGNKNESGYNKHEIYDTKKIISAISRLFGYITLESIKILIHHFALKTKIDEKLILRHLIVPKKGKKSFLMRAKFSSCNNCGYFLSREIYDEKIKDLYKDINTEYTDLNENDFEIIYQKYLKI